MARASHISRTQRPGKGKKNSTGTDRKNKIELISHKPSSYHGNSPLPRLPGRGYGPGDRCLSHPVTTHVSSEFLVILLSGVLKILVLPLLINRLAEEGRTSGQEASTSVTPQGPKQGWQKPSLRGCLPRPKNLGPGSHSEWLVYLLSVLSLTGSLGDSFAGTHLGCPLL